MIEYLLNLEDVPNMIKLGNIGDIIFGYYSDMESPVYWAMNKDNCSSGPFLDTCIERVKE
jgi:hypothetical protein